MNRHAAKGCSSAVLAWALIVGGIVALVVVTVFLTGWGQRITADFRGETERIEDTKGDGAFRQATYERFYALCSGVETDENRIANLESELAATEESRAGRVQTSLTAVQNSRAEKINQYNALAANETREAFRDSNLPERLDLNGETTCTQ